MVVTPVRYYFNKEILKIKKYVKGKTLDLACGKYPIKEILNIKQVINIDSVKYDNIDIVSDIHKLPFKNESIDTIFLLNALEHIKDPKKVLKEINRVLKKDGKLVLTVPFIQRYHKDPIDMWRYTPESMKVLLKDFNIIYKKEIGRVYCLILNFLYNNSPIPKFLILYLTKILYRIEKFMDKNVEHTSMWLVVCEKI